MGVTFSPPFGGFVKTSAFKTRWHPKTTKSNPEAFDWPEALATCKLAGYNSPDFPCTNIRKIHVIANYIFAGVSYFPPINAKKPR